MERRRSSEISERVFYPKSTKYLRIVEMILCVVCLGLAFYLWSTGNTLLGAIVIMFATAFGFLALTLIDVMASLRRRQYSAPVWAGLAFLAAFMFFLSFGFMLLRSFLPYILIGVVFAITGAVFLIDGIIIIICFFQSQLPKKVHPVSEEKKLRDEATQVDEDFLDIDTIEKVPIELKKVAPALASAPPKELKRNHPMNTSPRTSFPITSYGGTFPVGGNNAPPLPTPDRLTGLEPARPAQLHVPRRSIQENSTGTRSVSTETPSPRQLSIGENESIYPSIRGENLPEETIHSLDHDGYVPIEPGISQPQSYASGPSYNQQTATYNKQNQEIPSAIYEQSEQLPPATYNRQNEEKQPPEYTMAQAIPAKPQTERHPPYRQGRQGNILGPMTSPYQAAGEPQPALMMPPRSPLEARYPREILPGSTQVCQCCATRAAHEARDQVTPFVTHHYNQTPCVCGYTHYQASTIIKGAVKQHPEDTVQQQQKMIKDQLKQTRNSNVYQGCSCHDEPTKETKVPYMPLDEPTKETKVPYMPLVRETPKLEEPRDADSLSYNFGIPRTTELESNATLNTYGSILDELAPNFSKQRTSPHAQRRESDDVRRKVTMGSLDIISSSNSRRGSHAFKKDNQQRMNLKNQPKRSSIKRDNSYPEYRQPENLQPYMAKDFEPIENAVTSNATTFIPENDTNFRGRNHPVEFSKLTILSRDLDESSSSVDHPNESDSSGLFINNTLESGSPEHDSQYKRKGSRELVNQKRTNPSSILYQSPSPRVEPMFLDDRREESWTTEAEDVHMRLITSLPEPGNPVVCHGVPPVCMCCPNAGNPIRRSPTKSTATKGGRRTSNHSRGPLSGIRKEDMRRIKSDNRRNILEDSYIETDITPKIPNNPAIPRPLDPIDEHRLTEGIYQSDSEGRKRHIPPFHDEFEEDVGIIKQMSSRCTCICHPQSRPMEIQKVPKKYTAPRTKRYDDAQLNQKPYHPKDEFKMPEKLFSYESDSIDSVENSICEAPPRNTIQKRSSLKTSQDNDYYQSQRSTKREPSMVKKIPQRSSIKCLEECDDCSSKREKSMKEECLEECSSCPIRRAREAKLRENLDEEEGTRYFPTQ